jgi:hypothetical protein
MLYVHHRLWGCGIPLLSCQGHMWQSLADWAVSYAVCLCIVAVEQQLPARQALLWCQLGCC